MCQFLNARIVASHMFQSLVITDHDLTHFSPGPVPHFLLLNLPPSRHAEGGRLRSAATRSAGPDQGKNIPT